MQSLFPQHNSQPAGEKPLLQFKAGRCSLEAQQAGGFLVTPQQARGNIAIVKGEGYVYFRWLDRSAAAASSAGSSGGQLDPNCNWIVFQNSVVFKKIDTGRAEDRVYLLKWKDEDRRLMFWMQDKSADKDEENCKQVNELFNNPAAVTAAVAAARSSSTADSAGGANQGAEEWMRMLGLSPPGGRPNPTSSSGGTSAPPAAGNAQALDLARILAGLGANSNNIAPVATNSTSTVPNATATSTVPPSTTASNTLSAADLAAAFSSSMNNEREQGPAPTSQEEKNDDEQNTEEQKDNSSDENKMDES